MPPEETPPAPSGKEGEEETPPEGTPPEGTPTEGDELAKWKAMARKHEKDAKSLSAKVREFEEAGKSETERLTSRAETAEQNLTKAERAALRYEVAIDKGLSKTLAARLQGDNREDMEADADALLKEFGDRTPGPSFDGGARTPAPNGGGDMNAEIRARAGYG